MVNIPVNNVEFGRIAAGNAGNAPLYNLQGQRVDQPVKGLYIQNGKKVVVK